MFNIKSLTKTCFSKIENFHFNSIKFLKLHYLNFLTLSSGKRSIQSSDFLRSTYNLKKISSWFWPFLSKSADLSEPWGSFFSSNFEHFSESLNFTRTLRIKHDSHCYWTSISQRWPLAFTYEETQKTLPISSVWSQF